MLDALTAIYRSRRRLLVAAVILLRPFHAIILGPPSKPSHHRSTYSLSFYTSGHRRRRRTRIPHQFQVRTEVHEVLNLRSLCLTSFARIRASHSRLDRTLSASHCLTSSALHNPAEVSILGSSRLLDFLNVWSGYRRLSWSLLFAPLPLFSTKRTSIAVLSPT